MEGLQYWEQCERGTEDFPLAHYRYVRRERLITPHWHPEIEILYMMSGEMTVSIGEERHVLKEGDIFFINPEELHAIDAREHGADYHVAVFFPDLFQFRRKHFFEQEFIQPLVERKARLPRCIGKGDVVYAIIRPIVHRMFCEHSESKALMFADLTILFCEILERSMLERVDRELERLYTTTIKKCIRYMEENYGEKVSLEELAQLVHMSPNYFCGYFKKYVGVSPFVQLNYIRIKKAEDMLLKEDVPIVSVAEACGFGSVSFFIRKFKEITGYTPLSYRKEMTVDGFLNEMK